MPERGWLTDDPAATDNDIAIIKNGGLAGGDGTLGRGKLDPCFATGERVNERIGSGMGVADLDADRLGFGRLAIEPVDAIHLELFLHEVFLIADDHPVGIWIDVEDIAWARGSAWETLALTDREHFDALVVSNKIPLRVVDPAAVEFLFSRWPRRKAL